MLERVEGLQSLDVHVLIAQLVGAVQAQAQQIERQSETAKAQAHQMATQAEHAAGQAAQMAGQIKRQAQLIEQLDVRVAELAQAA